MTRIEVLHAVILAIAAAHTIEPTSIIVHEVIGDTDRTLGPRLPVLVTVSGSGNVQHVRPGARVVVLHAQDARTLDMQIAHLIGKGVQLGVLVFLLLLRFRVFFFGDRLGDGSGLLFNGQLRNGGGLR